MAVTKEAMKTLSSSQTTFLPIVEEPENNRINFRDSLKFFQEQLVINGANFPSVRRSGNDTLKKNAPSSSKENNLDNSETPKDGYVFNDEIQSVRSCKIAIPTVDTILESVRVLRAIQKSQEERGSSWKLDVCIKSDLDSNFNCRDDEMIITNVKQNEYSNQESENETDKTNCTTSVKQQVKYMAEKKNEILQVENNINLASTSSSKNTEEICSFWPSNSFMIDSIPEAENGSSTFLEIKNQNVYQECHKTDINKLKTKKNFDDNQNDSGLSSQIEQNDNNPNLLAIFTEEQPELENNFISSEQKIYCKTTDQRELNDDLENSLKNKTSFENYSDFYKNENDKILHNVEQNRVHIENHTELDTFMKSKSLSESANTTSKFYDTQDSLQKNCTDLLDCTNFNRHDTTQETFLKDSTAKNEILKIETYEDTVTPRPDVFILNEDIWKSSSSQNDGNSIKREPNDSDSGFGTQRSASSLSPNNHSQMQKDSWSDSCSSHYASAECSPYHSLNSVFESSSGLSTMGEPKTSENKDILLDLASAALDDASEKTQDYERKESFEKQESNLVIQQINSIAEKHHIANKNETDSFREFHDSDLGNAELDTEISYCNFITNFRIENTCKRTENEIETVKQNIETFNKSENNIEKENNQETILYEKAVGKVKDELLTLTRTKDHKQEDDSCDLNRTQKFTAASCDLLSIVQSLYTIKENPAYQTFPALQDYEEKFEEELFILSRGAFCELPEDNYLVTIEDSVLYIKKDIQVLCSINMKYGEVSIKTKTILELDNKMGKYVYIQCDTNDLTNLKTKIQVNILKHWQKDCLHLVHYPLKCHQNVVIVDLGSCSTRAGILMDQPTLPNLFFPTICATDKTTGTTVYGMEALQSEVRQHSNLSFPVRPTVKITKHTIEIDLLDGLFKKIFQDLKIDPSEYTIQVCLPRNLSINVQTALVRLLLEDLKAKAISLTDQALLTLYAHEVSTAVVVDIGDRIDVLPVVDGFIVENGVSKLPHGGQRLIHHMKHALAEKRISLSNDIDSFVVQYIIENLAYVAEDYEKEIEIASIYPDRIKKTVTFPSVSSENLAYKNITLEEARFKIPEGLFNPDLWGLDSPGVHHLIQKAIQATSVDARKQIAENIYVSGGVTMLPGFVERLSRETAKLSKTKIIPKVHASNYRYHCTYIGACKFAKMEVFSQVCITLEDYLRDGASVLKKCALYF